MSEYHAILNQLGDACRKSGAGIAWIPTLGGLGWSPRNAGGLPRRILWYLRVILRHITLVFRAYAAAAHRIILVREFATIPLAGVAPFLWPLRRKLHFTINHNLQWAAHRPAERLALRLLSRMGFRWLCFETAEAAILRPGNLSSASCWTVPMPVGNRRPSRTPPASGAVPVVGLVGLWRSDKNPAEVLAVLAPLHREGKIRLLVGTPDLSSCTVDLARAGLADLQPVDTTDPTAYERVLESCDVVVCNYDRASYEFRPSGIIADVAAARAAVLAPPWHVIRRQVLEPVSIGECFTTPVDLPRALETAITRLRRGGYDFETYAAARSVDALAGRLAALAEADAP